MRALLVLAALVVARGALALRAGRLVANRLDAKLLAPRANTSPAVVLIDFENVRGIGTGFALGHDSLLAAAKCWVRAKQLEGRVLLAVDHGAAHEAHWLGDAGLGLVFAGPQQTADDVLVRDAHYFTRTHRADVVLVSADAQLRSRARARAAGACKVHLVHPSSLVSELEAAAAEVAEGTEAALSEADRAALVSGLRALREPHNSRREKTAERIHLAEALRHSVIATTGHSGAGEPSPSAPPAGAPADRVPPVRAYCSWMLGAAGWLGARRKYGYPERAAEPEPHVELGGGAEEGSPVAEGVRTRGARIVPRAEWEEPWAGAQPGTPSAPASGVVRLVVISDTHGMEEQMFAQLTGDDASVATGEGRSTAALPAGDVLIHCGDWQADGAARRHGSTALDAWLAAQPHPHKLVVRGNHDAMYARFDESRATYVSNRKDVRVCGLDIAVAPYSRARRSPPLPRCDVLVSHVPPKGVLDKCTSGDRAGSRALLDAVSLAPHPPRLWLCGHVHEARGAQYLRLGHPRGASRRPRGTLVVNAANANSGRATHLCHPPYVIDVDLGGVDAEEDDPTADADAGVAGAPDADELDPDAHLGADPAASLDADLDVPLAREDPASRRLLSVDLGMRTGAALYAGDGTLLAYTWRRLESADELRRAAAAWLRGDGWGGEGWAVDALSDVADGAAAGAISHVAMEGHDVDVRDAWEGAIADAFGSSGELTPEIADAAPYVVDVPPDAWRRELLLPKERASGARAKTAAREIARQVVRDYAAGGHAHKGRFPTDAAEAVLAGYYAVRALGWVDDARPAVRRYQNGNVIL